MHIFQICIYLKGGLKYICEKSKYNQSFLLFPVEIHNFYQCCLYFCVYLLNCEEENRQICMKILISPGNENGVGRGRLTFKNDIPF